MAAPHAVAGVLAGEEVALVAGPQGTPQMGAGQWHMALGLQTSPAARVAGAAHGLGQVVGVVVVVAWLLVGADEMGCGKKLI